MKNQKSRYRLLLTDVIMLDMEIQGAAGMASSSGSPFKRAQVTLICLAAIERSFDNVFTLSLGFLHSMFSLLAHAASR